MAQFVAVGSEDVAIAAAPEIRVENHSIHILGVTMAKIVLKVSGMKCGGCENQVQDAVKSCVGVSAAKASHTAGSVEIDYDETKTDLASVRKAITEKGFAVG
ncbi:heavy-metal-associated domain-containing protein [Methylocaldum sp. MU1018]